MSINHDQLDPTSEAFVRVEELPVMMPRHPSPVHGGARFAHLDELAPFLVPPIEEEHPAGLDDVTVLCEEDDGSGLVADWRRKFCFNTDHRQKGIALIGMPGSFKTRKFMLPLAIADLADPKKVVVYLANKGDEADILQAAVDRHRPGQKVIVVNLSSAARSSAAFNPFGRNDDAATALDDAITFCSASEKPGSYKESPFWDSNAARVIAATRLCLVKKFGKASLADVHHAVEWASKELQALLNAYPEVPFAAGVASFLAGGGTNADTVLATTQGHLRAFRDPNLAAVTSHHELDWEAVLAAPVDEHGAVIVLETDVAALEKQRPVVNLFFASLFRTICRVAAASPGCRLRRPACVYLDDFPAAVGRIPQCGQYFATLRSRDCRLVVAMQTTQQLHQVFGPGESDAILAGLGTKIFCPPVEVADAELAARMAGITTVAVRSPWFPSGKNKKTSGTPVGRPLVTPDEVRLSPEHFFYGRAFLAFLPNTRPVWLWVRAIHDDPKWAPILTKLARSPRRECLRATPLTYTPPEPSGEAPTVVVNGHKFTDSKGMSDTRILKKLAEVKKKLAWDETTGSARKWWDAFESENKHRLSLVLRLAEELEHRKATITEFFLAYVYSNTDNIQANLSYLDYTRLKKDEEKKKKEAAAALKKTSGEAE